ncbi:FHA domain-containing protein [Ideonella sp. 4Y11]|uniref:FHA domain-containing protein n=1 Tax=Ideonella aquatica TaxID=2824119 RepID=A0A940YIV8_9BURK|nr:adenylate/guanylate cyclase domain-containing protein [Ideonella aquatica]MBQ0959507.1 FHA domain-containing protein [Ideonella aquatica]
MATIKRRIVLFADLRGSTALYETLGNAQATTLVTRTITTLARRVPAVGGQLVKTLGDGLMAVFPNVRAAVMAAVEMHEALGEVSAWAPTSQGRDLDATAKLQLQVAVAAGEVVEVGGDCFGDAVNVAARLIDHAGDNETLITREVFDELPWEARTRFRHLDKVHLRGRAEPVDVYLLAGRGADTAATQLESRVGVSEPRGLRLDLAGQTHDFKLDQFPVILGRSTTCSLKVEDARVSRAHARVDLMGGSLQLTDLSINGSFVRFAGDDEVISLRRSACTLHGSGEIGLGASPLNPKAARLGFTVLVGDAV